MSDSKPTTISAKRLKSAVDAMMPHVLQPAMMRLLLRQEGWSTEEIDQHQAEVAKAVAERFAGNS